MNVNDFNKTENTDNMTNAEKVFNSHDGANEEYGSAFSPAMSVHKDSKAPIIDKIHGFFKGLFGLVIEEPDSDCRVKAAFNSGDKGELVLTDDRGDILEALILIGELFIPGVGNIAVHQNKKAAVKIAVTIVYYLLLFILGALTAIPFLGLLIVPIVTIWKAIGWIYRIISCFGMLRLLHETNRRTYIGEWETHLFRR